MQGQCQQHATRGTRGTCRQHEHCGPALALASQTGHTPSAGLRLGGVPYARWGCSGVLRSCKCDELMPIFSGKTVDTDTAGQQTFPFAYLWG